MIKWGGYYYSPHFIDEHTEAQKIMYLLQGNIFSKWWSWDLNRGSLAVMQDKPYILFPFSNNEDILQTSVYELSDGTFMTSFILLETQ